jgi:hypothetical protein
MKRKLRYGARILAVALVVAILGPAVWVCSRTEGGWQILGEHFVAGLPPAVRPVAFRASRDEREDRWLLQLADRVEADPKSTADDYMGAALLFPTGQRNWSPAVDIGQVGALMWGIAPRPIPQRDREAVIQRGNELAAKATEIEAKNLDWWRLRAMRMGAGAQYGPNSPDDPPQPLAATVLREAAEHDLDNALYEYLLGYGCYARAWGPGHSVEVPGSPLPPPQWVTVIEDPKAFAEAKTHYQAALSKPLLATGQKGRGGAQHVLANTAGPISLKVSIGSDFDFNTEMTWLFQLIESPKSDGRMDDDLEFIADDEVAYWFSEQDLEKAWVQQWEGAEESPFFMLAYRPGINLSPKLQRFDAGLTAFYAAEADREVWRELDSFRSMAAVVAAAAGWLMVALAALAFGFVIGVRFVGPSHKVSARPYWLAVVAWLMIFAAVYAVCGMVPSSRPWTEPYALWLSIACDVLLAAAAGFAVWPLVRYVMRQGRLPRKERGRWYPAVRWALVIAASAVFVVLMECAIDSRFRIFFFDLASRFPGELLIPSANDSGALMVGDLTLGRPARVLERIVSTFAEWALHGGLFWTSAIWLFAMVGLAWLRAGRGVRQSGDADRPPNSVARILSCLRPLAKSALIVAAFFFLLTIAAATQWVDELHRQYEVKLARLGDPGWLAKEAEAELQKKEAALPLNGPQAPTSGPGTGGN